MTVTESPPIATPQDNSVFLTKILAGEQNRYERKGFGLCFATIIAISFFFGVPELAKRYWPLFLEWEEEHKWGYFWLHCIIGVVMHNVVHLGGNLMYWFFYHNEFSFIERYKSNDLPWPWKEDPVEWHSFAFKSILVLIFNGNVMIPVGLFAGELLGLSDEHSIEMEHLPTTKTLALSIAFFMLVEDFCFYWSHRFLHWKVIYPYIHKMHHKHVMTTSVAGEYAHPVEYVLGNMLPTTVGPMLLGYKCHFVTVLAWYLIRFTENLDGHCGYDFSWSPFRLIPFSSSAAYHDFHHAVNIGNYASFFSIWDSVFGTNKVFYDHLYERETETVKAKSD